MSSPTSRCNLSKRTAQIRAFLNYLKRLALENESIEKLVESRDSLAHLINDATAAEEIDETVLREAAAIQKKLNMCIEMRSPKNSGSLETARSAPQLFAFDDDSSKERSSSVSSSSKISFSPSPPYIIPKAHLATLLNIQSSLSSDNSNLDAHNYPCTARKGSTTKGIPFNRIKINDHMCDGARGIWYRGECFGSEVAIKKLIHFNAKLPSDATTFIDDIHAQVSYRSPHLVAVFGPSIETETKNCYIVMELFKYDVKTYLETFPDLSIFQRLLIALGICKGLAALADYGVSHGNVKLSNCFIDRFDTPKVGDLYFDTTQDGLRNELISDVYQFGVLLGQLARFTKDSKHPSEELPQIDEIEKLCDNDATSFGVIIEKLKDAIYSTVFQDDAAKEFWKSLSDSQNLSHGSFLVDVDCAAFMAAICKTLNFQCKYSEIMADSYSDSNLIAHPTAEMLSNASIKALKQWKNSNKKANKEAYRAEIQRRKKVCGLRCLRVLVARQSKANNWEVNIERFGKIATLFGFCQPKHFLSRISDLLQKPYFKGDITSDDAFNLLKSEKIGTFLVRFGGCATSPRFTLSFVGKCANKDSKVKKVGHCRISFNPNTGYYAQGEDTPYHSIDELIKTWQANKRLGVEYRGQSHQYEFLFELFKPKEKGVAAVSAYIGSGNKL